MSKLKKYMLQPAWLLYRIVSYILLAAILILLSISFAKNVILPQPLNALPNGLYLQDTRGYSKDYQLLDQNRNNISGKYFIDSADWHGDYTYGDVYYYDSDRQIGLIYFIHQVDDKEITILSKHELQSNLAKLDIPKWNEQESKFFSLYGFRD